MNPVHCLFDSLNADKAPDAIKRINRQVNVSHPPRLCIASVNTPLDTKIAGALGRNLFGSPRAVPRPYPEVQPEIDTRGQRPAAIAPTSPGVVRIGPVHRIHRAGRQAVRLGEIHHARETRSAQGPGQRS